MALIFDYEKTLETGDQPFISHEPDSTMYSYYITDENALDKNAKVDEGYYDEVTFADEERHLTTKAVSSIGIKNFPGIGGIGFYKDAYSDESRIIAPIHPERILYEPPVLQAIEIVDGKLHIKVEAPQNLEYTCYRVIVRQGAFAFEYITYKKECFVDMPTVKGDYVAYCIGYDEDNGTASQDSNELTLNVPTGAEDWKPYTVDISELTHRVDDIEEVLEDHEERITILEQGGSSGPAQYLLGNASEVTSDTSIESTITTTIGNLLVAVLVHRSDITAYNNSWTMLCDISGEFSDAYQKVAVFYKYAADTQESFTASQASSGRFYLNTLQFYNAGIPTLEFENIKRDDIQAKPFVVDRHTTDVIVLCAHMYLYQNSAPYPLWRTDPAVQQIVQLGTGVAPRLCTVIDAGEPDTTTLLNDQALEAALIGIRVPGKVSTISYIEVQNEVDGSTAIITF